MGWDMTQDLERVDVAVAESNPNDHLHSIMSIHILLKFLPTYLCK